MVALVATDRNRETTTRLIQQIALRLEGAGVVRLDDDSVLVLADEYAVHEALNAVGEALGVTWDRYLECLIWE